MQTTTLYPIPNPKTVSRVMDGEMVLVLPQRGVVDVVNELGQFVWLRVDGAHSVEDIVAAICSEYAVTPDQARQDVLAYLQELASKGALHLESKPD